MSTVMGTTSNSNVIDVEVYARGETGLGIESTIIEYSLSDSAETPPSANAWSEEIPSAIQGKYLWTRVTLIYSNETRKVSYSISYFAIDGIDGGWYTPAVAANGDLSWTPSKEGLPSVQTVNIKGPQGETGSVKFIITDQLPVTDIENDAFYCVHNTGSDYSEYYYIPNQGWQKIGDDLSNYYNKSEIDTGFYNKTTIDNLFNQTITASTTYYIAATDGSTKNVHKTKITYSEDSQGNAAAAINGQQITTDLFYSID